MKLAFRHAWRQVMSSRTRFVLLVIALAVPLAVVTAWFVLRASSMEPSDVLAGRQFGQAQVTVGGGDLPSGMPLAEAVGVNREALLQAAPEAVRGYPQLSGSATVQGGDGAEVLSQVIGRDQHEIFTGQQVLTEGRWPSHEQELLISPGVTGALNAEVGSVVFLNGAEYEVVGQALDAASLDSRFVITGSSQSRV